MNTPRSKLPLFVTASLASLALVAACSEDSGGGVDTSVTDADLADTEPADTGETDTTEADTTSADTVAPPRAARVVSLNLRCLIDEWDERLGVIVDALAALDPDVLGFQEVCAEPGGQDALPELLSALEARTGRTYATHRGVTHTAWDTYQEGLAVASAWPLADTATENLPSGVFPRKALLTRLTRPDGGTLVFATTHLDHQSDLTRKQQAEAVAAAVADFVDGDEAAVVTGDLNEPAPDGAVYLVMTNAGFTDLWAALHPNDAGPTFPSSNPSGRIDYVWLDAGGTTVSGDSIARIVWSDDDVDGSDHLGLTATLVW